MACSIQLVRLNDFAADIDSIDLSADGYSLDQDGYFPVVAPIGAKSVHEVITLKLQGTSKDDLAAMTQDIDEKIKQVQWWIDDPGVERYQVWLRVQQENESLPRQAQLLNIIPPDKLRVFVPEEINNNYIGAYSLGIERTPFWEDPYPYPTTTSISGIGSCGGIAQMSETINGDVPARLAILSPTPNGAAQMGEYWIGWKSNRFGNPANFQPIWSLDKSVFIGTGTSAGVDTTAGADVTAVDGNKLTCTFATVATLSQRTITQINDVISNAGQHNDQRGTYLVLLRAKMSDITSTARVRMLYSFSDNVAMKAPIYRSLQIISSPVSAAYWKLYPLGIAVIPSMRVLPSIALTAAAISLQAERLSGSGSLEMDCLVLIPVDDGAIHVASIGNNNFSNGFYANILQYANGDLGTYGASSLYAQNPTSIDPINYSGLIANSSRPYIVTAGQKFVSTTAQNVFTDLIDIPYTYIPRWRTLRGNVT